MPNGQADPRADKDNRDFTISKGPEGDERMLHDTIQQLGEMKAS